MTTIPVTQSSQPPTELPLMPRQEVETTLRRRSVPFVFYALGLTILVVFVLWIAQSILVPLVIAAFLSFLIGSVKEGFDRIPGIGKHLPGRVSYMLSFGLIVLVLVFFALLIRENVMQVIDEVPAYRDRLVELGTTLATWLQSFPIIPASVGELLEATIDGLSRGIVPDTAAATEPGSAADSLRRQAFTAARSTISAVTTATGNLLGNLVTIFLYTAFLLIERGRFAAKLAGMVQSKRDRAVVDDVLSDIARLIRTYISMKTLINLTVATMSYVIMLILGTDFAGFFALLIFIAGYIPIVGAVIAISLPTTLALIQPGGGFGQALLTLACLTAAEQSISSFVEPRVMGRTLNLSPLVILLSLSAWGTLWGFPGMLLSVPMTVVLLIILSQFHVTRPVAILLSDNGEIAPLDHNLD